MNTSRRRIRPIEGEWFLVEPRNINRNLFKTDSWIGPEEQQALRKINNSFDLLDIQPDKFGKPFEILVPKKNWENKTVKEMINMCKDYGGKFSTGIATGFLWAQIIDNGETPKNYCEGPDTLECYRLVAWENGVFLTGGSQESSLDFSATHIEMIPMFDTFVPDNTVPQIIRYLE